jgi:putative ABC transport system permease protein
MTPFTLAVRLARRDVRGATLSFRFLALCLTLGVAAITAVGVFAAAVEQGVRRDGRALLGGDVEFRLIQRDATTEERAALNTFGRVSHVTSLRAMADASPGSSPPRRLLVDLKAVDGNYPLVGTLTFNPVWSVDKVFAETDGVFGAASAPDFAGRLGLRLGDRFTIGSAQFELRAVIDNEPDRGSQGIGFGPEVMIGDNGLAATGLVRPGSLVRHNYRVVIDGDSSITPEQAADVIARDFPTSGFRARTLADATPQARTQIEQVRIFLTLVGFASLLVGGIGVAQAVQSHLALKRSTIAILKSSGASSGLIGRIYGTEVSIMAIIGIVLGMAIGVAVALLAGSFAKDALPIAFTAEAFILPLVAALASGALATFAFAIVPLTHACSVSPASLFRSEIGSNSAQAPKAAWLQAGLALLLLTAFAAFSAPDRRIVVFAAVGTLLTVAILIALGRALQIISRKWRERLAAGGGNNARLRLALANLARPNAATVPVMVALGLAMTLFVALIEVEGNLQHEIVQRIPDRAPAYFFIDIQMEDGDAFDNAVKSVPGVDTIERRPMLRGRVVKVNGVPIDQIHIAPGARWIADGDRGLTVAATPPSGTHLAAGEWWPADYKGPPLISFDAKAAQGFGIGIGDTLTFNVLGREIEGRIANLRAIDWTSFGVNFAIVLSPGALDGAPMTDLAAVYASPSSEDAIANAVADALPNVTAIRIRDVLDTAMTLLNRIAGAVEGVAAAALGAGLLVLIGALAAARRARLYEAAVLRAVGMSRSTVIAVATIEHGLIGLVAAVIAVGLGSAAAAATLIYAIGISWSFLMLPALIVIVVTMAATGLLGALAAWRLLAIPAGRLLTADAA